MNIRQKQGFTPDIIVLRPDQSLYVSLLADTYTFALLGICIYLAAGDIFWTIVAALMLLVLMIQTVRKSFGNMKNVFRSKNEVRQWLDTLNYPEN